MRTRVFPRSINGFRCCTWLPGQRLGMFQAREGVKNPLWAGSQRLPGHHACRAARKQFPSVTVAFRSPLAHPHIPSPAGPSHTRPLHLSFGERGAASFRLTPGGQAALLGEPPLPLLTVPPPPLLACLFPTLGRQGPFRLMMPAVLLTS